MKALKVFGIGMYTIAVLLSVVALLIFVVTFYPIASGNWSHADASTALVDMLRGLIFFFFAGISALVGLSLLGIHEYFDNK